MTQTTSSENTPENAAAAATPDAAPTIAATPDAAPTTTALSSGHEEVALELDTSHGVPIAVVTLQRDHKRNALDAAVCLAVATAVTTAQQQGARAVLIRGEGKAFCAGADLAGGVYTDEFHENLSRMLTTITSSPLPVIADIQGPAIGAGMQLAMACDLRVCGERAWFAVPVVKLGIAVDRWTIDRAKALLGGAHARNLLLRGARLDAAQAAQIGLAAELGDSTVAWDLACEMADNAPLTIAHLKLVLNDEVVAATEEQELLRAQCWASEDATEARAARVDKRQPMFHGR